MLPPTDILEVPQDFSYDDFTRLAKEICQTPLAKIVFTDVEKSWTKSTIGFEGLDESVGCCEYAVETLQFIEVPDTLKDERFKSRGWVVSDAKIRYYAGMPLVSQEGIVFGTISVMDIVPRLMTKAQQKALKSLSRLILTHLELRGAWQTVQDEKKTPHDTEIALKQTNSLLDATLESTRDGILIIDHFGKIVRYNQNFVQMWHIPKSVIASGQEKIIAYMQRQIRQAKPFLENLTDFYRQPEEVISDVFELKNGKTIECYSYPQWVDGKNIGRVWSYQDTTDRHEQAALLRHRALHDELTQLPNRVLFLDRVQQAILSGRRNMKRFAVLFLDLDGFKEVNDTLGHKYGDILLKHVSSRMKSVLREFDTLARLGGDEFAVLLNDIIRVEDTKHFAEKMLEIFEHPFQVDGFTLDMSASIGISLFPDHGDQVHGLIQKADIAMYMAKSSESNILVYSSSKDQHRLKRLILKSDLRHGIQNDQLFLLYQPKVNIKSFSVVGVEALVRWNHPEYGIINPEQFIGMAEQTGLIKPLTFWVLKNAMLQTKQWDNNGLHLPVAVNLSVRSLRDLKLTDQVVALMEETGFSPENLELEITESIIMDDPVQAMEIMTALNLKGVSFALDDFGTGYSSLSYLKRLPIQSLKIDRSFIKDMLEEEENEVIVISMIDLAHNLGIKIVAEGVEDEATMHRLSKIGCDEIQGFFFAPPISGKEMESWCHKIRNNRTVLF